MADKYISQITPLGSSETYKLKAYLLKNGRTFKVQLDSTDASTAFDGSANITDIGVSGILGTANGGTGNNLFTKDTLIYADTNTKLASYTSTNGGAKKLWYLNAGVPTDSAETVGATDKPVFLSSGTITESTSTIGSGVIPIYMASGQIKESTSTAGTATKPIWMDGGTIKPGTYELKATVNASENANRAAYYSTTTNIEDAGSIYMTASRLGVNATTYQHTLGGASSTSDFTFSVLGNGFIRDTIYTNAGVIVYRATAGYAYRAMDNTVQVGGFYIDTLGTTSKSGLSYMLIGNKSSATTAGNARGRLYLGKTGEAWHIILGESNNSTNHYHYLPDTTGWIVTAGDGTSTGQGGTEQPVYVNATGVVKNTTYHLKAHVEDGSVKHLAYYSAARTIDYTPNIIYYNDNSVTTQGTTTRLQNGLLIAGETSGNTASHLVSNTAGVMRFGDGGPQLIFSEATSGSPAIGSDAGAILFTNHDSAGTGSSFHFVGKNGNDNQGGNLHVTAPNLIARKKLTIGLNFINTSYTLYVNGSSYFNGNTTHNGIDYFANGTTYYINNSGTGNLNALTVNNTTASTTTGTGGLIVKGGAGIAGRVTASEFNATRSMIINAGKVYSNISGSNVILPAKTTMLFANGIAIANPGLTAANDVGWLRVTGTAETDMALELATGDDGGAGETIHVRQYNTSNTIVNDLTLLDTKGNTLIPNSLRVNKGISKTEAQNKTHIISPGGGSYATATSPITGALKIQLPVSWTSCMLNFSVDIYDYAVSRLVTYHIGGYNYNPSSDKRWVNTSAYSNGTGNKSNLTVRFGHDGTHCCVIIGEINTSWSYPQVNVRDVYLGYSDQTIEDWETGWAISFITTLPTITGTTITSPNRILDGTESRLAYYSAAGTISPASHIQYIPTQNAELGTTKGSVNGLFIYGTAYGNQTVNLGSATINVFRYGDPGPQIRFSTSLGTANAGAAESSAIIWSDNSSSIGTDQSFHFVGQNNTSHAASNVGVVTNTFIGKTCISAGVNYANTNYVLFSNGTSGINGQLYLQGASASRDTAPSSNDNRVLYFTDAARKDQSHIYFRHNTAGTHLMYLNTYSSGTKATRDHIVLISDTDTTDPHYIQINSRISTGLNISGTRGFAYNAATAGTYISAAGNIHITAASPYIQFYNNTSASYTGYIQDTAADGMVFHHATAATTAVTTLSPINSSFKPQFRFEGLTYVNGALTTNGSAYIKGRITSYDQWNIIYLSNITKTTAPSSSTDGGIILRDKAGTNLALFRIWENTSMDRCANMYVYGNSNSAEVSIFAKADGDRYLQWTGGIINHTVEARGLLKSTSYSNTVTIGSQNADFTHIYNSANIPFIFNKSVVVYDGDLGNTSYPWNNIYLGNRAGTANADIILHSSKANNTLIRFLVNTSNGDGQGIRIGGGGLTIIGGGESAATVQSGTGYASDAEQMLVANDSSIRFYPNQQSGYTASALIEMSAGRIWAGVNGDTTRENQIGVQSGAGQLYMYSAASATGAKGIYFSAHGDNPAGYIAHVDSAHRVYYNSNFTSQRVKLIASQSSQINSGVWLRTCTVQSYQNYANFQIRLTGGWSTGSPTVATIDVNMRNGLASMKLVHRGFLGVIGKVKLVKLETNTAYLDVYIREASKDTNYFGQFIGNVTVTQNDNTTHGTTNVTTTDVDGLATLDLTAGVGNASTPVYIDATGNPVACTAYSSATNIRAATVNINNDTTSKLFVLGATTTGYTSIYRESSVYMQNNVLYGAAWNDYAEFRQLKENKKIEPGRVVYENGDDTLSMSNERLMRGCSIVSDTYGFGIGESEEAQLPIAVSGRVLAYPYEDKEEFKNHIGWPVCSGPNGTVSIMTEEEEMKYPSRIIGTISAIPDYEIWHGGADVVVDGRVWIKVR